jgi:predicted permease
VSDRIYRIHRPSPGSAGRIDAFGQDVRAGLRALRHSRRFAGWVVGSLAIGMAVTIAALALLNASMVLPFPGVADQPRLVRVSVTRNCGRPDCWIPMTTPGDYQAVREGLSGVEGLAAYTAGEIAAALPEARSMHSILATPNYFAVLGVRPAAGRLFDEGDDRTDAAVAVIGHGTWIREFDGDPAIVGRTIRVADQFVQIIGAAPERFIGIDRVRPGSRGPDLWLPMWLAGRVLPMTTAEQRRQERDVALVGRRKQDVQIRQLRAEAEVIARRLAAARGDRETARAEVDRVWRVRPQSWQFGVLIVMPIPILVLVIACVNAANLMLARGSQRQREIAIRLAIGAGRGRIVRQLLIESALLAGAATALALPIAWWALSLASNPLGEPIPFDPLVVALTVLTAAVTTVAFGLAPAIRLSRQQPSAVLGPASGRGDALPRQSRGRQVLVGAQVALSLALLATAWQLVGTVRSQAVSGGTPPERLLVARFDLQPLKLSAGEPEAFYRNLMAGASRLPGAASAGVARHTAVWTFGQAAASASLVVWRPSDAPEDGRSIIGGYAGGDLFDAVGLRLSSGRGFTDEDRVGKPRVAVVNETAATGIGGAVIGQLLRVASRGSDPAAAIEVRVVGIVEPSREPRLENSGPPPAKIYLPAALEPEPALTLYLRTAGMATALAQPVRELVSRIAPRVPVQELGSLEQLNERSYATQLWLARAAALIGVIGLLLAAAGLYGVSSYVVAMRSREIAIRMAIGARPGMILTMILGQSMRIAAIGLVAGGAAAAAASRMIQAEYHGIEGIDAVAFSGAAALFLASMLIASTVPAVRASRVDPMASLKDG